MTGLPSITAPSARNEPVVTYLGAELPAAYLDEAEPGPFRLSARAWWKRVSLALKLCGIIAIAGFYPAMIAASHKIDTRPVELSRIDPWASPQIGTAITIVAREMEQTGWASDRPGWHPQAQLTGLPAWQSATAQSLSEYAKLLSALAADDRGRVDSDLAAAARLLVPDPFLEARPRLTAAAEAMARYEGRLVSGLATPTTNDAALMRELELFASWGAAARRDLAERIGTEDGWPAARADIRAFYAARGRANTAAELMSATLAASGHDRASEAMHLEIARTIALWKRAAEMDPLIVSSQPGRGTFMSDHLATLAFYVSAAEGATIELAGEIARQRRDSGTAIASTSGGE